MAGSGFRDTTRIASGNPRVWREIVSQNRSSILEALGRFGNSLDAFREAIRSEDDDGVERLLAHARDLRNGWPPSPDAE